MSTAGFFHDRSAGIAIIVALIALPLTALFGVGVETSNLSRQRTTTQDAADSAAIAGVSFLHRRGINAANAWRFRDQIAAIAGDIFAANAPQCGHNTFDVDIDGNNIQVGADCLFESVFGRLAGQQSKPYRVEATARFQTFNNVDIMFLIDVSASMCNRWIDHSDPVTTPRVEFSAARTCTRGKIDSLVPALRAILDQIDPRNPDVVPFKTKFGLTRTRVGMVPFHRSVNLGDTIVGALQPEYRRPGMGNMIGIRCAKWNSNNDCQGYETRIDLTNPTSDDPGFVLDDNERGQAIARDPKRLLPVIPPVEVGHEPRFDNQMTRLRNYTDDLTPNFFGSTSATSALHTANLILTGYWDGELALTSPESVSTPGSGRTLRVIVLLTDGQISDESGNLDGKVTGIHPKVDGVPLAINLCWNFKSSETQSVRHLIIAAFLGQPSFAEESFLTSCASGLGHANYINGIDKDFIQKFSTVLEVIEPHLELN